MLAFDPAHDVLLSSRAALISQQQAEVPDPKSRQREVSVYFTQPLNFHGVIGTMQSVIRFYRVVMHECR